MSISSQKIQPNHETKGTIPNIIKTQHNSTKSKKQAIEQEEDTKWNVSSIKTSSFTKRKTRVNKVDELLKKYKKNVQYTISNSIAIFIVDSIEQLTTSYKHLNGAHQQI